MRKWLSCLLLASMLLSLTACGSAQDSDAPTQNPEEPKEEIWLPYDENGAIKRTDRDASGTTGAVASSSYYASRAGLNILKAGGNAADAAIAVAYTLGVVEPYTSGLGGGGFMTVYSAETGKVTVVDFRETAPALTSADIWTDETGAARRFVGADGVSFAGGYSKLSQVGGLAAAVPGEVAGLEYVREAFGSGQLSRARLMQEAIDLASEGYYVTATMKKCTEDEYYEISRMEEIAAYYLDEIGLPFEVGAVLTNPELAKTLTMIAENGADAFYRGEVAEAIVDSLKKYGGVMTLEDLDSYHVEVREPVQSTYRGYQIYSTPPASSGGTHLIEILNIIENFDMAALELNSAQYVHLFSEAFKMAFADRAVYMADTAFHDVPLAGMTDKAYASALAGQITDQAGEYGCGEPALYESGSTTSFSVVDQWGNMVACTQTINDFYGCKVAVKGYGFLMNDEMADFSPDPQSVNCAEGGKRPLSSMSPTIVLYPDGSPFATIGSPGGVRIFTTLAQVIERMIDYDMDIQDAINAGRIYDNESRKLCYESGGILPVTPETVTQLNAMGHETLNKDSWDLFFGGVQGVTVARNGQLRAGADPRRDGKALAY